MRHLSLFNGIGGFQLAASWCGWQNIAHVEISDWCNSKVAKHFPKSQCFTDIKKFDGTQFRNSIDIISGGFPCQPFSVAGKQRGASDDLFLWPEMFRTICEVQPEFVVAENVPGLINQGRGLVFRQIVADLENEGFEVLPFLVPAIGVGAWHQRERLWIIAYSQHNGHLAATKPKGHGPAVCNGTERKDENIEPEGVCSTVHFCDTIRLGLHRHDGRGTRLQLTNGRAIVSNPDRFNGDLSGFCTSRLPQFEKAGILEDIITDTNGLGGFKSCKEYKTKQPYQDGQTRGVISNPHNQRCEKQHTSTVTSRTGLNTRGITSGGEYWAAEPGVGRVANGVPNRVDRIKGLGNAIVPQVAYHIFKEIDEFNKQSK